jgi:hypothetical protein
MRSANFSKLHADLNNLQNYAGYGYDSPKYANTDAPGARRPVEEIN